MPDTKKRSTLSLPSRPEAEKAEDAPRTRAPIRNSGLARPRRSAGDPPPERPAREHKPRPESRSTEKPAARPGERTPRSRSADAPKPEFARRDDTAPRRPRDESRGPAPTARRQFKPDADSRPASRDERSPGDETPARRSSYAERDAESGTHARRTRGEDGVRTAQAKPRNAPAASEEVRPRRRFADVEAALRNPEPVAESQPAERPATRPRRYEPPANPAPQPRETQRTTPDAVGAMRLSKRMAELGLCSRREADEYIERGWVKVDGVVIDELGSKILPDQHIELTRGAEIAQNNRITILINKPIGYVSGQAEDGYEPASVLVTAENHWEEDPTRRRFEKSIMRKLAPAGRLDIDSTGMLVLTQDGRIAKALIGEYSEIEKEYLVRVEGELSAKGLKLLNHGLMLDGVELLPAKVSWQNEDQLRFVLREGRKRQIRRMCELVGLTVVGLKRIRIGRITLSKLPVGQWRYLGENERF